MCGTWFRLNKCKLSCCVFQYLQVSLQHCLRVVKKGWREEEGRKEGRKGGRRMGREKDKEKMSHLLQCSFCAAPTSLHPSSLKNHPIKQGTVQVFPNHIGLQDMCRIWPWLTATVKIPGFLALGPTWECRASAPWDSPSIPHPPDPRPPKCL